MGFVLGRDDLKLAIRITIDIFHICQIGRQKKIPSCFRHYFKEAIHAGLMVGLAKHQLFWRGNFTPFMNKSFQI